MSFLRFLFKSGSDKGNVNATGTGFEVKDVRKVMDFKGFESALGSQGVISSTFWTP